MIPEDAERREKEKGGGERREKEKGKEERLRRLGGKAGPKLSPYPLLPAAVSGDPVIHSWRFLSRLSLSPSVPLS